MVSWMVSRVVVLVFGLLYPAYSSYKAVKTKNVREYVRWMMYWIVFALFMTVETFTDIFVSWFPFYYEIKMAFVIWLLSPYTRGASLLYRKCIHPALSLRDEEIDSYIVQAKERGYESVVTLGRKGLNIAASAAVQAATKGQGALVGRLRSFSMQDLRELPDDTPLHYRDPLYPDAATLQRRPIGYATQSQADSDSMDERWSDSETRTAARTRGALPPKPLQRSQSLRTSKKKVVVTKEGSAKTSRPRAKKKVVQSESEM
ncbi:PREDICTED: receptor expression-enhancing protein 4 isoform X2 [Nanorana parkeri]|uniref:receptor expression-enhancing protein 4 isoform X2 n=1 Tax=Nanorana parkeri TaxID=125878 RepID=UPI000854B93E|nr:PREDICTED: receptor expression-enhancing protein 4 isoform X2 [Nanorana parkeri]